MAKKMKAKSGTKARSRSEKIGKSTSGNTQLGFEATVLSAADYGVKGVKIILLCALLWSAVGTAAEPLKSATRVDRSDTAVAVEQIEKRFVEERHILERQADRQYSQLKDTFDTTLKLLGVLITVAGGLFFFFLGRSRKEVKELVDGILEKEIDEIVAKDIEPVREKLVQLQGGVDQLMSFKNKRVVWLASANDDVDGTLGAFSTVGLNRVEVQVPDKPAEANVGDSDLVIVSFDGAESAKQVLHKVIEQLKARGSTIHLVVYTFGNGTTPVRIDGPEMQALAALKWFSMANFPSTMIAQVVSLVRGAVGSLRG